MLALPPRLTHRLLVPRLRHSTRDTVHMLRRFIQIFGTMESNIRAPDCQVGSQLPHSLVVHRSALGFVCQQVQAAAGARCLRRMQQGCKAIPLHVLLELSCL